MHYVLMIHTAEARAATLSKNEGEAMMQAYGTFTRDIFATGRAGDCAALEGTQTATCIQIRGGKRTVKDGPFADTREQLGGYYVYDAATEEDALAWAAKIPGATGGTVEVRPVVETGPAQTGAAFGMKVDAKGQKEYLLLVYEAESRWMTMSEADQQSTFGRYRAFNTSLKASEQLIAGDQLDTVKKAKSVSNEGSKRIVRDGPFVETREQLGGYYRVLARDLDDAIAMASRIPAAETGTIEIRPVRDTSAYA